MASAHLLAWRISGLRTQLLCGNHGDNSCLATTGLHQCAYIVGGEKKSSLVLKPLRLYESEKKKFQSYDLNQDSQTQTTQKQEATHTD